MSRIFADQKCHPLVFIKLVESCDMVLDCSQIFLFKQDIKRKLSLKMREYPMLSPILPSTYSAVFPVSGPFHAAAKSPQSCPTLCGPIDGSPPGSPVPGILQARTLEWVAISSSNAWKWKVKVKSLSRVLATPWTAARQAPHLQFCPHAFGSCTVLCWLSHISHPSLNVTS